MHYLYAILFLSMIITIAAAYGEHFVPAQALDTLYTHSYFFFIPQSSVV